MADINASGSTESELDKLIDAGTARIGNAPTNFSSVDDFENAEDETAKTLSLIHISEPTRHFKRSRMPSSA